MEKQGVSRSELARRMDVSPAYITKILRGHTNLGLETLAKLAFALELKWEFRLIQLSETESKDLKTKPKTSKPKTSKPRTKKITQKLLRPSSGYAHQRLPFLCGDRNDPWHQSSGIT